MKPLLVVARQESVLAVRSRWTQIFAAVFAGLALAVAASGYVLSGGHGVQDFAAVSGRKSVGSMRSSAACRSR